MLSNRLLSNTSRRVAALASKRWSQQQEFVTPRNLAVRMDQMRFYYFTNLSRDDEEQERRRRSARLYIDTMPRILLLPVQSTTTTTKKWFSTTTPEKEEDSIARAKKEETTTSSSSSVREKLRERYDKKRQEYRERADVYRNSAREHYKEFKEHPGETAKEGAKTISGMIKQYGPVFVGTYASVYFLTLAGLFAGVESGVLDPVVLFGWLGQDTGETANTVQLVVDFMENHAITKPYAHVIENNPAVANLAVAWIAVKFTEPIRLAASIGLTPRVARYFGYSKKTTVDANKSNTASHSTAAKSAEKKTPSSSGKE